MQPPAAAPRLNYQVANTFPHDTNAFLQGLLWSNGNLYESTGLTGQSTLRRVDLTTGQVLQSRALAANVFGEGLALANDELFQLTLNSQRCFVYDRATFNFKREHTYTGEGWGLTYNGSQLVMSDGTDTLTFRNPATFGVIRRLVVRWDGNAVDNLNELEWIEGRIWANVFPTNRIVQIDPANGNVVSYLDLASLAPPAADPNNVLNGIAYDAVARRIFVSGKRWANLYQITVSP